MRTILFPGWGVPPETYADCFGDVDIVDYGFFSDAPAAPLTPPDALDGPVRLIGHSLGTLLAVQTAVRFSRQIDALILYAPFARFTAADGIPGHPTTSVESMLRQCAASPERMLRAFRRNLYHPDPLQDTTAPSFIDGERLAAGLRLLLDTDITTELAALADLPCTVIYGGRDAIVPPDMTRHFLALAPHAAGICRSTGHMGILSERD